MPRRTSLSCYTIPVVVGKQFVALGNDSRLSVLDAVEAASVIVPTVVPNDRLPLVAALVPGNTAYPASTVCPSATVVLVVLLIARQPKMLGLDARFVPANVINLHAISYPAVSDGVADPVRQDPCPGPVNLQAEHSIAFRLAVSLPFDALAIGCRLAVESRDVRC